MRLFALTRFLTDMQTIPIPERMGALLVDSRGYPIPVVVQRDQFGKPLFAVNDSAMAIKCTVQKLCSICGQRLTKELWYAGGPRSALDPQGCYFDSAMHHECLIYALQVCPYLALRSYRTMDVDTILPKLEQRLEGNRVLVDLTQEPTRPQLFVVVMSYGRSLLRSGVDQCPYSRPLRPYHAVEYWRHGRQIQTAEAMEVLAGIPGLDLSMLRLIK